MFYVFIIILFSPIQYDMIPDHTHSHTATHRHTTCSTSIIVILDKIFIHLIFLIDSNPKIKKLSWYFIVPGEFYINVIYSIVLLFYSDTTSPEGHTHVHTHTHATSPFYWSVTYCCGCIL